MSEKENWLGNICSLGLRRKGQRPSEVVVAAYSFRTIAAALLLLFEPS